MYANAYIDDTSCYSNTWNDHLKHLDLVLSAFETAGMTLKLKKCKFSWSTLKYIGHVIGSGNIEADQAKIEAIVNMPTNKKVVQIVYWYGQLLQNVHT